MPQNSAREKSKKLPSAPEDYRGPFSVFMVLDDRQLRARAKIKFL